MVRVLVTGAPLQADYVARLEALDYEVINGSPDALTTLGVSGTDAERELTEDELRRLLPGVCVYVYGGLEPASRVALAAADQLSLIVFLGTGWSDPGCVDASAAKELGIRVSNTPHANARSTAEMSLALLLSLERQVVPMNRDMRLGQWTPLRRREVLGRRLGIVGLGHVGSEVAKIAVNGFGMQVKYAGPNPKPLLEADLGIARAGLVELLETSEYISIHTPGSETLGMLDSDLLGAVPPDSIVINTAVPEIIDGASLATRLESGQLRGLGMDGMYKDETVSERLRSLDDRLVLFTPRAAWLTDDSYRRMATMATESVEDHAAGRFPVKYQVLGTEQTSSA